MWTVIVMVSKQTPQQLWTGTNGPYLGDQMQYLGWIRSSAQHVLIGNPYQIAASQNDYLQPGLALSGVLARLGVSAWLAYLLWTPVAALVLFVAARVYVRRLITGTAPRRCALIIALFYISPIAGLADVFHWNQLLFVQSFSSEMWPGTYLWGYPFTAICVALMVGTLINYERDRRNDRLRPWAPICALLCAWLQPWQGATLVLILLVSEVWLWFRHRRTSLALPGATVVAATIPLIYYFLLSHLDATWALSGRVDFSQDLPVADLVITVLPLGACSVLAYRFSVSTFQDVAVRIWPIAAFTILWSIQLTHIGTFPKHSLQGLSVPFALLAVIGVSRIRLGLSATARVLVASLLVAAVVAAPVFRQLNNARTIGTPTILGASPFFIRPSERDAFNFLNETQTTGGVLSPVYLGQIVPAETGRQTWVGIYSWTPDYQRRTAMAEQLFSGELSPTASVEFVRSSGARFLLGDCQHRTDLTSMLRPILQSVRRFGCASVYEVRSGS
jgi:hypothetical protein